VRPKEVPFGYKNQIISTYPGTQNNLFFHPRGIKRLEYEAFYKSILDSNFYEFVNIKYITELSLESAPGYFTQKCTPCKKITGQQIEYLFSIQFTNFSDDP